MLDRVERSSVAAVRIVIVPDAFRPERGRTIESMPWKFGGYISDYLPDECIGAPDSLVVLRNGTRVPSEQWKTTRVLPCDEIGIVLWPADPGTIFVVVVTIISLIVSAWSADDANRRGKSQGHHMATRAAAMSQHMQDSAIYGWDGVQNTTQPGRSILVVYGLHRVGGQVIFAEPYKNKQGRNELQMILCLSQGEIEEVQTSTVEINGQPISEYKNVSVESRVGTNSQVASTLNSNGFAVKRASSPGTEVVASGSAVTLTTEGDISNYEIDLSFPGGLRSNGGFYYMMQASFSIRHRISPAGPWTTPVVIKSGWKQTTGSFTMTYRSPVVSRRTHDIEITRLAHEFKFPSWIGGAPPSLGPGTLSHRSYINQLREFDNSQLRYPNVALLHLSALATDQISGIMPTVTVIVKGRKVNVYTLGPGDTVVTNTDGVTNGGAGTNKFSDGGVNFNTLGVVPGDVLVTTDAGTGSASNEGSFEVVSVDSNTLLTLQRLDDGADPGFDNGTGVSYRIETALGVSTPTFSRNPAWCILDLLTNSVYGAGQHLAIGPWNGGEDVGDLDIQSFIDAAAFCDTLISRKPSADDPIDSGASATTTAASNTITLVGSALGIDVQPNDTISVNGGNDANSYRIDTIDSTRKIITVSETNGSAVSFTGDTGEAWDVDATDKRAECDYVIDGQTNVLDAVSAMGRAARMVLVQGFGPYSLVPDKLSTPVAVFGSGNIIEGSYRHEYLAHRMLANRTEVQFLNAALNYHQDIVQVEDPDVLINNEEVIPDPQEAYSTTKHRQAQWIAKYHYLSNRYEREMIEFETSIEGLPVKVFDVIIYIHELQRVEQFFSGRAAAGTDGLTLKLGQAITIPAGTVDVYLQMHDEDSASPDGVMLATIQESEGERVDTVTVTEWVDLASDVTYEGGPTKDDPWVLVPRASPRETQRQWKVLSVTLGQEGRRKIRAVAYREEVYNEDPIPATLVTE